MGKIFPSFDHLHDFHVRAGEGTQLVTQWRTGLRDDLVQGNSRYPQHGGEGEDPPQELRPVRVFVLAVPDSAPLRNTEQEHSWREERGTK